jgi:hypothetical protein
MKLLRLAPSLKEALAAYRDLLSREHRPIYLGFGGFYALWVYHTYSKPGVDDGLNIGLARRSAFRARQFAERLVTARIRSTVVPALVSQPPGTKLWRLVSWLPPKIRDGVYGQIIADMREECFDALKAGDKARFRWACLGGHWAAVWITVKLISSWFLSLLGLWKGFEWLRRVP